MPSSVQLLSHVQHFVTSWTVAHQASLSITNSQSLITLNIPLGEMIRMIATQDGWLWEGRHCDSRAQTMASSSEENQEQKLHAFTVMPGSILGTVTVLPEPQR